MSKENLDDLLQRAALTFVQGAVASSGALALATDWSTLHAALVGAASGGAASVLSSLTSWLRHRSGQTAR